MGRPMGVIINWKHPSTEEGFLCGKKNRIWLGSKIKMLDVNNGRQDRVLYTKHLVVQQAIVDHKKGTISYELRYFFVLS